VKTRPRSITNREQTLSEPQATGLAPVKAGSIGGGAQARAAIARASQATGVDFQYLLAQAKLESSLDPTAKAPTSSAAGLYQFTNGTWLDTLGRHGAAHGLSWAGDAITSGKIADPAMRAQVMALRYDPDTSAMMAAELASDNRADLTAVLGRTPDSAELYLGHFLGAAGASTFLTALSADPSQSAAAILPKAAAANRAIFYSGSGPRSVGGVMDLIRSRVSGAMEGGEAAQWASAYPAGNLVAPVAAPQGDTSLGPVGREFAAARAQMPKTTATLSMAETLQGTFGSSAAAPANVRAAYDKLARFGL